MRGMGFGAAGAFPQRGETAPPIRTRLSRSAVGAPAPGSAPPHQGPKPGSARDTRAQQVHAGQHRRTKGRRHGAKPPHQGPHQHLWLEDLGPDWREREVRCEQCHAPLRHVHIFEAPDGTVTGLGRECAGELMREHTSTSTGGGSALADPDLAMKRSREELAALVADRRAAALRVQQAREREREAVEREWEALGPLQPFLTRNRWGHWAGRLWGHDVTLYTQRNGRWNWRYDGVRPRHEKYDLADVVPHVLKRLRLRVQAVPA